MAYTDKNYKTKKALVEDFKIKGPGKISVYQPGPFGPDVKNGSACLEGPHYPEAHRWYASVTVQDGYIVAIKGVKFTPAPAPAQ